MFNPDNVKAWALYLCANRRTGSTTRAAIGADVTNGRLLCATHSEAQRVSRTMYCGKSVSFTSDPPLGHHGPVVVDVHTFAELCLAYANLHESKERLQNSHDYTRYELAQARAKCARDGQTIAQLRDLLSRLREALINKDSNESEGAE